MEQPILLEKFCSRGGEKYCDNREFVLAAVKHDGSGLKYASDRLKDDKEVVLAAVAGDPSAIEFASEEMKKDAEVLGVIQQYPYTIRDNAVRFVDELKRTKKNRPCLRLSMSPKLLASRFTDTGITCFPNETYEYVGPYLVRPKMVEALYIFNEVRSELSVVGFRGVELSTDVVEFLTNQIGTKLNSLILRNINLECESMNRVWDAISREDSKLSCLSVTGGGAEGVPICETFLARLRGMISTGNVSHLMLGNFDLSSLGLRNALSTENMAKLKFIWFGMCTWSDVFHSHFLGAIPERLMGFTLVRVPITSRQLTQVYEALRTTPRIEYISVGGVIHEHPNSPELNDSLMALAKSSPCLSRVDPGWLTGAALKELKHILNFRHLQHYHMLVLLIFSSNKAAGVVGFPADLIKMVAGCFTFREV